MRFILYCEASPILGMGHFIRILSIAEQASLQNTCVLVMPECPSFARSVLTDLDIKLFEVFEQSEKFDIDINKHDWLITDTKNSSHPFIDYALNCTKQYFQVVDQLSSLDVKAQIGLYHSASCHYQRNIDEQQVIGGPEYKLIRNQFLKQLDSTAQRSKRSLLIAIGATDPENTSQTLIEFFVSFSLKIELSIMTTSANPHLFKLKRLAQLHGFSLIIDTDNVAQVYAQNQLLLIAAGTALWEAAAMSKCCILVATHKDQLCYIKELQKRQAVVYIGTEEQLDLDSLGSHLTELIMSPERQHQLAHNLHNYCDGQGARRVIELISVEKRK